MRLDWWLSGRQSPAQAVIDEAMAFTNSRSKIFLVESQEEYDLASALQYIHGREVNIKVVSQVSMADVQDYLDRFPLVYTSWDPLDPNRI